MKQYLKKFFPVFCLLVCLFCSPVLAASVPGKVTGLKATSSDSTIKLRWNKASSAKKYAIYRVSQDGTQVSLVKKTSGRSYNIKGTIGVTYYFKVCALNSAGKSGAFSSVVSVTPSIKGPDTPKNFALKSRGNKYVTLKWSGVSKSNGYVIEQYNNSTGSYDIVKDIKSKSTKEAQIKNLTENTTYKFRVRSYRTVGSKKLYSSPSDAVSVKAVTISSTIESIRAPYYKVTTKSAQTVNNLSDGGTVSLKKGTSLLVTAKTGAYVNGYLNSGTRIKIRRSALKYTGLDSRSDYSTSIKEQFVNSKGYASKTRYFIWVSQHTYRTNVYKGSAGNWTLVKSFPCIIGRWNNRTTPGIHQILKKSYHGSYGAPSLHFTIGNGSWSNPLGCAFHNYVDGNRTGAKSHGCVRLSRSALTYLYNTCPVGTAVLVY